MNKTLQILQEIKVSDCGKYCDESCCFFTSYYFPKCLQEPKGLGECLDHDGKGYLRTAYCRKNAKEGV